MPTLSISGRHSEPEPDPEYTPSASDYDEWTKGQKDESLNIMEDFTIVMSKAGYTEKEIEPILARIESKRCDPETPFDKWASNVALAGQRYSQKKKEGKK